jgi:hypothetical protein
VEERNGVRLGLTLIAPSPDPFYTLSPPQVSAGCMGRWLGCSNGDWPRPHAPVDCTGQVAGLVSFKETGPLLLLFYLFSVFSLQFKFSLNLNSNLVSIPINLCNLVENSVI